MQFPIALLLHQLPDGSSHVDLLIARDDAPVGDEDRLIPTWRVVTRPDRAPIGSCLPLTPIADHRGLYLRLAELRTLTGERGAVTPLRRGSARRTGSEVKVRWDDGDLETWQWTESSDRTELTVVDRVET